MSKSFATSGRAPSDTDPPALHSRAMSDLRFIRETMSNAISYTAFSGWGLIAVGVIAFAASVLVARLTGDDMQTWVWLGAAALAFAIGNISTVLKARAHRQPLLAGPVRRFALSFAPALLAGGVLTFVLMGTSSAAVLPGIWLLLYGAGLAATGTLSVWAIPAMGGCFFALGVVALLGPATWGNALLGAGFGGLHIVFGAIVARKHGG